MWSRTSPQQFSRLILVVAAAVIAALVLIATTLNALQARRSLHEAEVRARANGIPLCEADLVVSGAALEIGGSDTAVESLQMLSYLAPRLADWEPSPVGGEPLLRAAQQEHLLGQLLTAELRTVAETNRAALAEYSAAVSARPPDLLALSQMPLTDTLQLHRKVAYALLAGALLGIESGDREAAERNIRGLVVINAGLRRYQDIYAYIRALAWDTVVLRLYGLSLNCVRHDDALVSAARGFAQRLPNEYPLPEAVKLELYERYRTICAGAGIDTLDQSEAQPRNIPWGKSAEFRSCAVAVDQIATLIPGAYLGEREAAEWYRNRTPPVLNSEEQFFEPQMTAELLWRTVEMRGRMIALARCIEARAALEELPAGGRQYVADGMRMVPGWPTDPFSGEPIRIVSEDDAGVIWSVGPDGTDNSGAIHPPDPRDVGVSFRNLGAHGADGTVGGPPA